MKIKLSDGKVFFYKSRLLYHGRKKINIENEKENLYKFSELMKTKNINFTLGYGTLLGAIRENGFISHDEDIDLCLKWSEWNSFKNSLFDLRQCGFELVRYDERGFISIMRNQDYIDLYFYKPVDNCYSECCGNVIKNNWLDDTITYELYGNNYNIPRQYLEVLEIEYGKDWKTPIDYSNSVITSYFEFIKQCIKMILPKIITDKITQKKSKKLFNKYMQKFNNYEYK